MNEGLFDKVRSFIKKIDPSSWPAFFMFFVVLCAAGGLNYIAMAPLVGSVVSVILAAFFGVGVLSWHIVESRTDDSKFQEDTAKVVKWTNAGLDFILIVVNLMRADTHMANYNTTAYIIFGVSAASHVVGYLLWTENDTRRITRRELERGLSDLTKKGNRADIAIKTTEEHMRKLKWINDESIRLRKEYANIPGIDVEKMIKAMKEKALGEFKDVKPEDVADTKSNPRFVPASQDVQRAELSDNGSREPNPTQDPTQAGKQQ